MHRRVRVERSYENLDLRVHPLLLLRRLTDNRKRTCSLTVQTHVLGKALGEAQLVTLFDEVADRECIAVGIATGETLVCHVKERVVLLLFDHLANLFPLLLCRVNTGRVVSTCVQKD